MATISTNDARIAAQKNEEGRRKRNELALRDRIQSGLDRINAAFSLEGGQYGTPGEWNMVPTYKTVTTPATVRTASHGQVNAGGYGDLWAKSPYGQQRGVPLSKTDGLRLQLYGRDKFYKMYPNKMGSPYLKNNPKPQTIYTPATTKRVKSGDKYVYEEGGTKTQSGLGQDFYDNFYNAAVDLMQPEVDYQYGDARGQSLFNLARRGLLKSTAAVQEAERLTREKGAADANVRADAENQVAGLQGRVNDAQQNAVNMLYATEDPTQAFNTAQSEINAVQTANPTTSELGNLFSSVLGGYGTYRDAENQRRYRDMIPVRDPNQSAGRSFG